MEEKEVMLSQEEEEKVSGGIDLPDPNPILKVFCHQCGSHDIKKGIKFDSYNRKIYVYHCNNCGNTWESLPIPMNPNQK